MSKISKSSTGSLRFNDGKPEVSQLDPRFILALADLMTQSAKKYGKFNWSLGQEFHTPFDSCMRHLLKFMGGENLDDESGKSHLIHAAANLMIMFTSQQLGLPELDTRNDWNKDKEIPGTALTESDLDEMATEHETKLACLCPPSNYEVKQVDYEAKRAEYEKREAEKKKYFEDKLNELYKY